MKEEKKIVVYRNRWMGKTELCAGVLISQKKTCKIRPFESRHFDGYRVLLKMDEVVAIVPPSEEIIKYLKETRLIINKYEPKIKALKDSRRNEIKAIEDKIKLLSEN